MKKLKNECTKYESLINFNSGTELNSVIKFNNKNKVNTNLIKNKLIMENQLFIVCPFSCMEAYLQKRYGKDIFFLTYSAGVIQLNDHEYLEVIEQFILREGIKKIYLVNDTSCRFLNSIIEQNKMTGLASEKELENLYIEHYFSLFKDKSIVYQQNKLAELNIKNQAMEMFKSSLGNCILESGIEIKGLITTKQKDLIKELQIDTREAAVYEF